MMKVVAVTPQWLGTTGGPSRYVEKLQGELGRMGHTARVVTTDSGPGAFHLPARSPQREFAFFQYLRRERPDVVHIHGRVHFIPSAIAYRALNPAARIVFTFYTQPYIGPFAEFASEGTPDYPGFKRRLAMSLLGRCDAITTLSASIVENLNRFYSMGLRDTLTIPSGGHDIAPSEAGVHELRERLGLGDAWPVVGSIGVFSWDWKIAGHLSALRALSLLKARYPKIRMLIAGDGAHRAVLEAEVARLDLTDQVHFLGNVGYTREMLALADIYLHMAPHEGCSLAIIEAMFAARPIVASNEGGTAGTLEHGATARLSDRAPANVANEVSRLLDDPVEAHALADAARRDALRRYSWPRIALQYESLFSDLLARRSGVR